MQTMPLVSLGLVTTLSLGQAAYGQDLGLDFDLPGESSSGTGAIAPETAPVQTSADDARFLSAAPVDSTPIDPGSARADTLSLQPETMPGIQPEVQALLPSAEADLPETADSEAGTGSPTVPLVAAAPEADSGLSETATPETVRDRWFAGGSDALVAIAIGAAEGTRQPNGAKNPAYYWHADPGNKADNFGTFSYQHLSAQEKAPLDQARTITEVRKIAAAHQLPEKADQRQLTKLKAFYNKLQTQAQSQGLTLNDLEMMNGLDLANQSEEAALAWMGYVDRLAQMKQLVSDPDEQILEARVWSYWDPQHHRWDAPGLGNQYDDIRADQARRFREVKAVLDHQEVHLARRSPPGSQETEAIAQQITEYNPSP